jgi:hypothetical protein
MPQELPLHDPIQLTPTEYWILVSDGDTLYDTYGTNKMTFWPVAHTREDILRFAQFRHYRGGIQPVKIETLQGESLRETLKRRTGPFLGKNGLPARFQPTVLCVVGWGIDGFPRLKDPDIARK